MCICHFLSANIIVLLMSCLMLSAAAPPQLRVSARVYVYVCVCVYVSVCVYCREYLVVTMTFIKSTTPDKNRFLFDVTHVTNNKVYTRFLER